MMMLVVGFRETLASNLPSIPQHSVFGSMQITRSHACALTPGSWRG